LMSTFKNNIIANSTFSWWSAWINKNKSKKVLYPQQWFSKENNIDPRDLFPAEWSKVI